MKLFLKILLIIALVPQIALAFDFKEGGLCYNINDDGKTVTLTYERLILFAYDAPAPTEKGYIGNIEIPSVVYHEGKAYKVTAVDRSTFMGNSELVSVIIPSSVTSVGTEAFSQCHRLKWVSLPQSLTEISSYAFAESSLNNIVIPNVKSIGERAFYNTPLKTVVIPPTVKTIDKSAFSACRWLEELTLGKGVESIGEAAFSICTNLKEITFPTSLQEIGTNAFFECGVIKSVTIPASVTRIGTGAFSYCDSLSVIEVDKKNEAYDSRNKCNAIIEKATSTLVAGCISTKIPKSVTSIGDQAFAGCRGLKEITIPSSVTTIGDQAFFYCKNLSSVNLPNSVTSIGNRAFCGCDSLETVIIPNSVKYIGPSAFLHNDHISAVTIGSGVTMIDEWAFKGLDAVTSITSRIEDVSCVKMGKAVFDEIDKSACTLYVPRGTAASYKAAPQWQDFKKIVEK